MTDVIERVEREHGARLRNFAARNAGYDQALGEDAYQVALTKLWQQGPRTWPDAVKWMTTVLQREAWAVRRRSQLRYKREGLPLMVRIHGEEVDALDGLAPTQETPAERIEYLDEHRAALRSIKGRMAGDARLCLLLIAAGYSYREIRERTGWTKARVNRLTANARRDLEEAMACS